MQPVTRSLHHRPLMPGVVFRERAYAPGGVIAPHSHAHTTLILVIEGAFREEYEGRVTPRRPGELHVLPADMRHTTTVDRAGARVFLVGLHDDWLNRSSDRRLAVTRPASTSRGTRAAELGRLMYDEFHAADPASGLALEGLLLETLGVLLRTQATPPPRDVPPWLAHARDRLDEEFKDPPAVAELAAQAGVSGGYLHRAFRARFHCTPGAYVRRARMRYVKRALRESRDPISRIAFAAGFSDQAHLTRCFGAAVGVTPGAYRTLHAAPNTAG